MSRRVEGSLVLAGALLLTVAAGAQEKSASVAPRSSAYAYDVAQESTLQGRVVSYIASSSTPPLGAHVIVQTSSGTVDVHLGSAQLLASNHFSLAAGESVRIVGENMAYGSGVQFFARSIAKGNQSVELRSEKGFPLRPLNPNKAKEGVL